MSQPHQVFIIARLIPHGSTTGKPYYHCIGARYHLSCDEILPLAATRRFLTLIKNEDNAEIIRDELHRAQYKYGRREHPFMPLMPCPYTLLLMTQAWDVDLGSVEKAYASGIGLENSTLYPDIGSCDGDPEEGISIIDVTDPSDPAYCFVFKPGGGPMDMKGYIAEYYDTSDVVISGNTEGTIAVRALEIVSALEGVRVLTSDALAEAWPDEYDPSPEIHTTVSAEPQNPHVPSLVELTLSPAVDNALASNDIEQLEYLLMIPGKPELVKKFLMTKNPLPDSGAALLTNIITREFESTDRVILDLSEYPYLSSDQVVHIVKALTDTLPRRIKSLKLSGNQNISTTTIVEVLKAFPQLLRLVLLNTSITDGQLLELISTSPNLFFSLHDLVHPAFLHSVVSDDLEEFPPPISPEPLHRAYRHGLTFVSFDGYTNTTASVPFFNPEQLLIKLTRPLYMTTQSQSLYFNASYVQSRLGPILALSAGTTLVDPGKKVKDGAADDSSLVLVDGGPDWYSRSVVSVPRTRSLDCFKGVGWIFILKFDRYSMAGPTQYGFVKVDGDLLGREEEEESKENVKSLPALYKIYDVKEFFKEMKKGRPIPNTKENGKSLHDLPELIPGPYKIYDVKGFLTEMEKEGRPIPHEEAVAAFEQALEGSLFTKAERHVEPKPAVLISDEEFSTVTLRL
ncbi:hypothetical protein K435DRAFT_727395 [Dendrothele bispora CBS 962.96]|uniref:RNI-like protein n=1 Tax=Dendrothele bispora (strain CBS 962.96) TaxID=1314807 RepID=A0A4S8LPI8_DENBC|nr:hypothetical protein K435DRAFT_727395 [Dendrothele bispora CBS 962.96]